MRIETARLILRDYRPEDWERVHLYGVDPEFSKYEIWGPNSEADTRKFVSESASQTDEKERYKFELAVCLKEDGLLIGGCGLRREAQRSVVANIGWAINPQFQGQGYASEAATALIRFGFESLDLSLVYATCDARNGASFRVMEKIGMIRVGLIEKERLQKGFLRDTLRYEIES